jgi:V/A-type H+-transporting ATPase subunit A
VEVKEKKSKEHKQGVLKRIAGPVVTAVNLDAHMYDVVKVGNEALMGEVIKIQGNNIIIQVYEDTSGIRPENQKNTDFRWQSVSVPPPDKHHDGSSARSRCLDKMATHRAGCFCTRPSHEKKWLSDRVKDGR